MDWNSILGNVVSVCVDIAWKLLLSVIVLIAGKIVIKMVLKLFSNKKNQIQIDPTAKTFLISFVKNYFKIYA